MESWAEYSGKTLEEALEQAAGELGAAPDDLDYEVVEEPGKGLFGIGQHSFRVRARVRGPVVQATQPEASSEVPSAETPTPSVSAEVVSIVQRVLAAMQFDAAPKPVSETPDEVQVEIDGDPTDIGRLIGRHGQTLDALQYIVSIAASRVTGVRCRILLDAGGYRARHQEALEEKAREIADQVRASGEEAVLDPQSARDRRIVHMVLVDDPDVYTYSEGDGDDRHIVISPRT